MADLDLLLHIGSYPTPTPDRAIDDAVRLAVGLGGKLTGLAIEVAIPVHSNRLADYLIGLTATPNNKAAFKEWIINGVPTPANPLIFTIQQNTVVTPVFDPAAGSPVSR